MKVFQMKERGEEKKKGRGEEGKGNKELRGRVK